MGGNGTADAIPAAATDSIAVLVMMMIKIFLMMMMVVCLFFVSSMMMVRMSMVMMLVIMMATQMWHISIYRLIFFDVGLLAAAAEAAFTPAKKTFNYIIQYSAQVTQT